jgi:hypothetical protein
MITDLITVLVIVAVPTTIGMVLGYRRQRRRPWPPPDTWDEKRRAAHDAIKDIERRD